MLIIETSIFTKLIKALLSDEEYQRLQEELVCHPAVGQLLRGSGGLRKARWRFDGRGKRGSIRLIYYWDKSVDRIYMLFVYKKSEFGNLSNAQLMRLKSVVQEELSNAR